MVSRPSQYKETGRRALKCYRNLFLDVAVATAILVISHTCKKMYAKNLQLALNAKKKHIYSIKLQRNQLKTTTDCFAKVVFNGF